MTSATMSPGSIALVTGASSGIGLAIANALLARSLRVIAVARNAERLADAFNGVSADALLTRAFDVTDASRVASLLDDVPKAWRAIDVLVANAGSDLGGRRRFDEGSADDWASTVEINVNGVVRVCHAVIPGMLERGRGHILCIGSNAGLSTYAGGVAYATSKHALHAFCDGLRKDYKHAPLRITEIMPGLVRTGFAAARHRGDEEKARAFYDDAPAALTAEHIAEVTLFALSQPDEVNLGQILVTPTGDK